MEEVHVKVRSVLQLACESGLKLEVGWQDFLLRLFHTCSLSSQAPFEVLIVSSVSYGS